MPMNVLTRIELQNMCKSLRERIHNSFSDDGLTFCVIELIVCIVGGGGDGDDDDDESHVLIAPLPSLPGSHPRSPAVCPL